MAIVARLTTSPGTVGEDYARLFELAGAPRFATETGAAIIPDLTWHHHFPGCSTPPWQLDGAIQWLKSYGLAEDSILVAIPEAAGIRSDMGPVLNRLTPVVEINGIATAPREHLNTAVAVPAPDNAPLFGSLYPGGVPVRRQLHGRPAVYLPTLKTHSRAGLAGAAWTVLRGLTGHKGYRAESDLSRALTEALIMAKTAHPVAMYVMDAAFSGDGPGPCRLKPRVTNVILASTDPVALDTAAAYLMSMDPRSIPYLRDAFSAGIGVSSPDEIEYTGDDIPPFAPPFTVGTGAVDAVLSLLESSLFATPLAFVAYRSAMIYNDWYWYIKTGESRIREMLKTPWGALFESFRR